MSDNQSLIKRYWPILVIMAILSILIAGFTCRLKQPTVALIIRHAEKASTPADNPPLSAGGQARAQELIHVLGEAGVSAIYATQFLRTQQTVEPLASHLGIAITEVAAVDIDGLINQLRRDYPGRVVLIAGHSNTLPQIIEKLGGGNIAPIAEDKFDNLFLVSIPWIGRAKTVHLKYGSPS
jgi:broad specificity phosphatase PhoE